MPRWPGSPDDRFWAKVERRAADECWPWRGAGNGHGYGHVLRERRTVPAHRVAYELVVGPIPTGLTLDHLCRNRLCVNPAHLEPVTHRVNTLRGCGPAARRATVTHCPYGHAYTPENTYVSRRNQRECRTCRTQRSRMRQAA
jgi:hypothetical protein